MGVSRFERSPQYAPREKALREGFIAYCFNSRTHNLAEMFTADVCGIVMPFGIRVVEWDFFSDFMASRSFAY